MFDLRIWLAIFSAPWLFALVGSFAWLEAAHGAISSGPAQESTFLAETRSPHEMGDRRIRVRDAAANENRQLLLAAPKLPHDSNRETAMLCKPEIRRQCRTLAEAHQYLASRGFLLLPHGWANGRWQARIESDREAVVVSISLEVHEVHQAA